MTAYLLKFLLSSALFLLLFYAFLQNGKTYKFNRFYLLFSILFSISIPLVTINLRPAALPFSEPVFLNDTNIYNHGIEVVDEKVKETEVAKIISLGFYFFMSLLLFLRYLRNIYVVAKKIRNSKLVLYRNTKLILTNEIHYPFSFLKYIFVNSDDFNNNRIETEILSHELCHVNQKHSYDILFVELLFIFAWINPILFLYKRAIQLNHEFLADESVIRFSGKTRKYQYLLINKSGNNCSPALSSTFNFLPIKKRIIMMNKNESTKSATIKKIGFVPLIVAIGFVFAFKTEAQKTETKIKVEQTTVEATIEGVTQQNIDEYNDIISRHKKLNKNGKYSTCLSDFTKEELNRMQEIFNKMSKNQRLSQQLGFIQSNTMYLKKATPSEEQFKAYKDSKKYGIWINDKRVKNEILNDYKNSDFSQFNVSKLMKNAKNYGKHYYQVNMMTNEYYQAYKNKATVRTGAALVPIKMYKKTVAE